MTRVSISMQCFIIQPPVTRIPCHARKSQQQELTGKDYKRCFNLLRKAERLDTVNNHSFTKDEVPFKVFLCSPSVGAEELRPTVNQRSVLTVVVTNNLLNRLT